MRAEMITANRSRGAPGCALRRHPRRSDHAARRKSACLRSRRTARAALRTTTLANCEQSPHVRDKAALAAHQKRPRAARALDRERLAHGTTDKLRNDAPYGAAFLKCRARAKFVDWGSAWVATVA